MSSDRIEDVPEESVAPATDTENVAAEDGNCFATVCAWVVFLLVTSMFGTLVVKGNYEESENFPLGFYLVFVACIVSLCGFLLGGIGLWHRDNKRSSFLTSLLFLLAVLAMAMAGVLPIYLFPCVDTDPSYPYYDDAIKNDFVLVTETENLPSEIQTWWENVTVFGWDPQYPTYSSDNVLYFNTTGVGLYTDTDGGVHRMETNGTELWNEIGRPKKIVPIDDGALACFVFETNENRYMDTPWPRPMDKVACTDGVSINPTEESFDRVHDLLYSNELLWFRCLLHSEEIGYGDNVLYSMDPFSPQETLTLHSELAESFDPFATRECSNAWTLQSISWFLLSSIPALLLSIALDLAYQVPSMPIGQYASFTWLVVYGFAWMWNGVDMYDLGDFMYMAFQWWSVWTAGPWVLVLTFLDVTNRITKSRLVWSIHFAALMYTIGVYCLFDVFYYYDSLYVWGWIWLTVAIVPGLIFISMMTGRIFLMILAAVVILIDVWRLVEYIVYDVGNWQNSLPAQVVVLVLTSLLLGFLIYVVWKRQPLMETVVSNWAESKLGGCWRPPSVPSGADNECPTHAATNPTSSVP